ncbi:MAG: hypothetical protein AAB036_10810 [Elusimicrobiota bacterium]
MTPADLWKRWVEFFDEEPADEPRFDPVHLATVLVAGMAAVGVLFWLLWGVLVYEGGLGSKEGWQVNVGALVALIAIIEALRRADRSPTRSR